MIRGIYSPPKTNFTPKMAFIFMQGFRKIDPDKWEFANEAFLKGQKHLLRNIRRRKTTSLQAPPSQRPVSPCVEVGRFGLDAEIDSLRRDKQVLFMELVKLRQQQMHTRAYLQQMEMRLQGTERKQQQMMSFLARAMQNPDFIHQLIQQKEKRKELEEAVCKKRRRPIKPGESSRDGNRVKIEPMEFGNGFQVSELEALALEMQGIGREKRDDLDGVERDEIYDKELDDGFWEELLNEGFDEVGLGEDGEEDVDVLAHRLGFLGSRTK